MVGQRLAWSTALVAGLTLGSQLLGLLRDVTVAAVFGVDATLDAYLVAQGLMNLVLALMAGAVAKAVVPTVARAAATADPLRRPPNPPDRAPQQQLPAPTAVIQPGGSMLDADVIAAADEAGLAMVFTGIRHFRH